MVATLALNLSNFYRLIELFLSQTVGVGWDSVASEAWRLEPGASDELIKRIDSF
ncbi:MAG: iron dependent repressor, metal binding and dimerization domain protein, partial [Candidatus Heimdallarchaeota archaeon]